MILVDITTDNLITLMRLIIEALYEPFATLGNISIIHLKYQLA